MVERGDGWVERVGKAWKEEGTYHVGVGRSPRLNPLCHIDSDSNTLSL